MSLHIKEDSTNFSLKLDYQDNKSLSLQHIIMNYSRKWAPTTESAPILKYKKQKLKQQWIWDSMNSNLKQLALLTWNYHISVQINLLILIINLNMISLNGHFSSHLKIFSCITIHQTSIFRDPRRQNPSSDSKMVGCYPLFLLSIFIKKKELARIKYLKE